MTAVVPMSVEEINSEWFTAALRHAGLHAEVVDCRHTAIVRGNATKVRCAITYATGSDPLPTHLCAKVGMELQDQSKNLTGSTYDIEGRFYLDIAPRFPGLQTPRCLSVIVDERTARCALVLEDVIAAGSRFGSPLEGDLSPAQVEGILHQLAMVHGKWWRDREGCSLRHLETGIERSNRLGRYYSTFDSAVVASLLDKGLADALPADLRDPSLLVDGFWHYADLTTSEPPCLIHADPHLGNIVIHSDGTCAIADWQTLRWGPWSHDVAYLIVSTLSVEQRRASEDDLLVTYLDALGSTGATPPTAEHARALYSASLAYGTFGWLTCPPYFGYPLTYSKAYLRKFALAAHEHSTFTNVRG